MAKLIIAPLAMPESITKAAYTTIQNAEKDGRVLILQTEKHPAAEWIIQQGIPHTSLDDLYDSSFDFDELNISAAKRLICGQNVVFAACGRGAGAALFEKICEQAKENDTEIKVLPSSGYAEAAASACGFSLAGGLICAANEIPRDLNVNVPLCVEEIDNPVTAGEVKLKLSEFYPDAAEVIFCCYKGSGYVCRTIPLYELDRQKEYFAATLVLVRPYEFLELERYGAYDVEELMRILRAPGGCPWDRKQTHESLKSSLLEETYEVLDAIIAEDEDALCEELGDLLLQIVFHAQIETEKSCFTMRDVCTGLVKKLIFRHPHVFANRDDIKTPDDVLKAWGELKKVEKHQKTQLETLLAVPKAMPALMRSAKVQKRAADVGFDWDSAKEAFYKIAEETKEVEDAMQEGNAQHLTEEIGDLLFAVVNVARLSKVDAELALSAAADKFTERFCIMEDMVTKDGKKLSDMTLPEMDEYWEKAKKQGVGRRA